MAFRRRVERRRDGSFTIRLGDDERRLLGSLPGQLATLAETAGATSLTEEQLHIWSQALNDLRLYLGTRLDLSEETTDEDFAVEDDRDLFILYSWLGFLQEETIEALSRALPRGGGPKPLPPDPPPL